MHAMTMTSYTELQREIARLMQQAEEARKAEIRAVVADIKAKMTEYGITAADLGSTGRSSRAKGTTVAAKYRHPSTGETWTGRGKMPRWLQAEVNAGKRKEDFLIG
jgi:DNA-binding protein H-NS